MSPVVAARKVTTRRVSTGVPVAAPVPVAARVPSISNGALVRAVIQGEWALLCRSAGPTRGLVGRFRFLELELVQAVVATCISWGIPGGRTLVNGACGTGDEGMTGVDGVHLLRCQDRCITRCHWRLELQDAHCRHCGKDQGARDSSEEPLGGLGLLDLTKLRLSQLHLSLLVYAWTRQSMISGSFPAGHHDVSALDGSMVLEEREAILLTGEAS